MPEAVMWVLGVQRYIERAHVVLYGSGAATR